MKERFICKCVVRVKGNKQGVVQNPEPWGTSKSKRRKSWQMLGVSSVERMAVKGEI